jgi:hypothetical protein
VGDFVVQAQLGSGTFGTVYEGRHALIGKRVAIKILARRFADQADTLSRFAAEARAVNEIGHPNLIDIFSFGALPDGRPYHVMELLRGETLRERLWREAPLTLATTLELLEPRRGDSASRSETRQRLPARGRRGSRAQTARLRHRTPHGSAGLRRTPHRRRGRGGDSVRISLEDGMPLTLERDADVIALDEALERLAVLDPRQADIVVMRFFGGLSMDDVASHLRISKRAAEAEWTMIKAWLRRELTAE